MINLMNEDIDDLIQFINDDQEDGIDIYLNEDKYMNIVYNELNDYEIDIIEDNIVTNHTILSEDSLRLIFELVQSGISKDISNID